MRRRFSIGFVVLLAVAALSSPPANSQSKKEPDFSGTWLLDQKKSNDPGLTTRPDLPIKISHHEPEFRLTIATEKGNQIVEHEFVYFTDSRGETNSLTSFVTTNPSAINPGELKKQVAKSKTKWSGNKIVTRAPLPLTIPGQYVEFEQIDEWKLSGDGKVLTQTSRVVLNRSSAPTFYPAMARDKKRVYNRV
ncbi:MAG TPA: hypothetical protein VFZ40_16875 [Pyrinomonadaceae bacterium]